MHLLNNYVLIDLEAYCIGCAFVDNDKTICMFMIKSNTAIVEIRTIHFLFNRYFKVIYEEIRPL